LTLVVLLVLAALWAVVLLPPLLRSRTTNTRSVDSIGEFNYKLGVLGRTGHAAPAPKFERPALRTTPLPAPASPRPARYGYATRRAPYDAAKRRADVLRVLVVAVALTMALAYFTGAPLLWGVQIVADVCLLAFLGLSAWARSLQADRAEKVRFLPQRRTPEFALRRTASS
jgi:hypothetical protein